MIKYQTMNNNNSERKDNPRSLQRIRHTWILRQFHALNQLSAFTLRVSKLVIHFRLIVKHQAFSVLKKD